MDKISDEILMAYADDALQPAEMRQIAALVARDPSLASRLEPFVVTHSALPQIFSDAQLGPIPSRLLDTVMSAPIGVSKRPAKSAGIVDSLKAILFPDTLSFARTFALCGTVLAVAGAGWIASRAGLQNPTAQQLIAIEDGKPVARGVLARVLETAPMLQNVASAEGQSATPVVTFRNANGSICRQFAAAQSKTDTLSGYACRDDAGQWQVGFYVTGQNSADPNLAQENAAEAIMPAGRESNPDLDAAIENVISGDAMDGEKERALIANGWKPNAPEKAE